MTRRAGVLLHPTSLPGPHGIGDVGPQAVDFLDWASSAGLQLWQVLPLGPTGHGNSPYSPLSTFAANPLLISPEWMVEDGLVPAEALVGEPTRLGECADFGHARSWKEGILRRSWERVRGGAHAKTRATRDEVHEFAASPEQAAWLPDWTLYAALKEGHEGRTWYEWDPPLTHRRPAALAEAERALAAKREYFAFVQWLFRRQWRRLHDAARARGIALLGDVPIYPALDSAEVWAQQPLFMLDEDGRPREVAGVPPDYFSETGQLWGNPLYRWDRMEAEGFAWWIARTRAALETCDLLRLDHFRGFASYWAVPAGERTAMNGRWMPGPGPRLFSALRDALGGLPMIAEDLGLISDDVRALLSETGLPGMRVLQFGLPDRASSHHPRNHIPASVVYTGTHDNDTARGWFESLDPGVRGQILTELGSAGIAIEWDMIRVAFESPADTAIVPMQDLLGLGSAARMNTPSEPQGNWGWRMRPGSLTPDLARRLRDAVVSGRRDPGGIVP